MFFKKKKSYVFLIDYMQTADSLEKTLMLGRIEGTFMLRTIQKERSPGGRLSSEG